MLPCGPIYMLPCGPIYMLPCGPIYMLPCGPIYIPLYIVAYAPIYIIAYYILSDFLLPTIDITTIAITITTMPIIPYKRMFLIPPKRPSPKNSPKLNFFSYELFVFVDASPDPLYFVRFVFETEFYASISAN